MTAELKIRGVPYRSIAEVEEAILSLASDLTLMDEEDEATEPIIMHIGELLSALPDDAGREMLRRISAGTLLESSPDAQPESPGAEDDEQHTGGDSPQALPVCPMCGGHGTLELDPPQDPSADRCPACDGFGKVYTGSRVEGHSVRDCPTCNGNGYVGKQPSVSLPPPVRRASAAPAWPNATWNSTTLMWDMPTDQAQPPWEGATWDGWEGKYV